MVFSVYVVLYLCRVSHKYSEKFLGSWNFRNFNIIKIETCIAAHVHKRQSKDLSEVKEMDEHRRVINWKHLLNIMSSNRLRDKYFMMFQHMHIVCTIICQTWLTQTEHSLPDTVKHTGTRNKSFIIKNCTKY